MRHGILFSVLTIISINTPVLAQDPQQVVAPFLDLMGRAIDEAARQQELDRIRNSPEYRDQQIQPGGLTRGQVIIVQQLLMKEGYDVGASDGEVGPKTRAAVAIAQHKASVPITGLPDQQLLDALLVAQ
jgi:peptidoglycan hydrolase-like protein with peptidoglycan-binding domain